MTKREDWETPEGGTNEVVARKLADLGLLMRETAHVDSEPPNPAFVERLKNDLLRAHWPTPETTMPTHDEDLTTSA